MVTAGKNLTLACPGVNEHSLIDTLSWKRSQQTIVKFVNGMPMVQNQRVSFWCLEANFCGIEDIFDLKYFSHPPQISLLADNYSLFFNKALSSDTGEYSCIINDRHSPESIIDLLIQGKYATDMKDFIRFCWMPNYLFVLSHLLPSSPSIVEGGLMSFTRLSNVHCVCV